MCGDKEREIDKEIKRTSKMNINSLPNIKNPLNPLKGEREREG